MMRAPSDEGSRRSRKARLGLSPSAFLRDVRAHGVPEAVFLCGVRYCESVWCWGSCGTEIAYGA
eukprot:2564123-Rhodomonas_salina.2